MGARGAASAASFQLASLRRMLQTLATCLARGRLQGVHVCQLLFAPSTRPSEFSKLSEECEDLIGETSSWLQEARNSRMTLCSSSLRMCRQDKHSGILQLSSPCLGLLVQLLQNKTTESDKMRQSTYWTSACSVADCVLEPPAKAFRTLF